VFTQVDLKYITSPQIIEFPYEGKRRRFVIDAIAAKLSPDATDDSSQNLSRSFNVLSIDSALQLWSISWDCVISIATDDISNKETASQNVCLFNCSRCGVPHDRARVFL
jgi:AAA family ATPase